MYNEKVWKYKKPAHMETGNDKKLIYQPKNMYNIRIRVEPPSRIKVIPLNVHAVNNMAILK